MQHPFVQKQIDALPVWQAVANGEQIDNIMEILQMEDNPYINELRNQIDLVNDEQLGNDDDEEEKLTEEEQKLFDDF